jgi:hypothetical protein
MDLKIFNYLFKMSLNFLLVNSFTINKIKEIIISKVPIASNEGANIQ